MRFTSFLIENFKGIEKLEIKLNSDPNSNVYTLVGLNESGKTTILEAINMFKWSAAQIDSLGIKGYQVTDLHTMIPIGDIDNFNGAITIITKLVFEEGEFEKFKKEVNVKTGIIVTNELKGLQTTQKYHFTSSRFTKENTLWGLELEGKKAKQRKSKKISGADWQLVANIVLAYLPQILYFPNFLFDFPDKIYLSATPEKSTKIFKFYKTVVQDILDSLDNGLDADEHLVKRIEINDAQARRNIDSVLLKMSRKTTSTVFDAWNTIFGRKLADKKIVISYGVDEEGGAPFLQFQVQDGDGIYKVSERSLGFRWFFVFLLLTQFRSKRLQNSSNVLFLFDEPASNLHSTAQALLLQSFHKLPNVIYTTHSHHLVNPKWLESTYVVRNEGLNYDADDEGYNSRKTKVSIMPYRAFVNRFPTETSYFQPILDVLDYKPGALENIPNVVITEGKNDYYSLLYFMFLLGKEGVLNILPGTSASNLEVPIQTYLAWGKNFVALLDSDKEGIAQQKRYKNDFGLVVENKIFTLLDVDSAWVNISMENLFSEKDKLEIIRLNFPEQKAYDKSMFNKSIQECLVRERKIEVSNTTKVNFEKLISFCKTKLNL